MMICFKKNYVTVPSEKFMMRSDVCTISMDRDDSSGSGYPRVLDPMGVGSGSFLHPRVEPTHNRVQVQVSFFTRGCTRNPEKNPKPKITRKKTQNPKKRRKEPEKNETQGKTR
jgi:hypothetical protein